MSTTEAQLRAIKKYEQEKLDKKLLRLPKGELDLIRSHAEGHGESINGFILRAIRETIERDNNTPAE